MYSIVRLNLPTIDVVIVNESCRKPLNRVLVELSQLLAEQEGGLATNDIDICIFECCEKYKSFKLKIPQPDSERRHSPDFRTVFGIIIWLWKLKFSIFVCLFVYLFVCTSRFANFARGKWSNHNSKNCSEIRAVTPF